MELLEPIPSFQLLASHHILRLYIELLERGKLPSELYCQPLQIVRKLHYSSQLLDLQEYCMFHSLLLYDQNLGSNAFRKYLRMKILHGYGSFHLATPIDLQKKGKLQPP